MHASEYSVLDIGEGVRKYMNKKTTYANEPLGKLKVVPDFLPSPEELSFKDDTIKVTISLSKASVEFFKKEAKKNNTQYQKMVRRLLDAYTDTHRKPIKSESSGRALKEKTVSGKKSGRFDNSGIKGLARDKPVVYQIQNSKGKTIYIGVAKRGRVKERLKEHLPGAKDPIRGGARVTIQQKSSFDDALKSEARIIKRQRPAQNKKGK